MQRRDTAATRLLLEHEALNGYRASGQHVNGRRLMKKQKKSKGRGLCWPDLGAEDDGVAVEEEGEVAGEIKRPRQPPPRRHHQHRAALAGNLAEAGHSLRERGRVRRHTVSDPAEVRQAGDMGTAPARPRRRVVDHFLRQRPAVAALPAVVGATSRVAYKRRCQRCEQDNLRCLRISIKSKNKS